MVTARKHRCLDTLNDFRKKRISDVRNQKSDHLASAERKHLRVGIGMIVEFGDRLLDSFTSWIGHVFSLVNDMRYGRSRDSGFAGDVLYPHNLDIDRRRTK